MPAARQVIDASGKHVIPGVVDMEHHPAQPIKECMVSETRAAAGSLNYLLSYLADPQSALPRPPKELKGFARVWLEPGEATEVFVAVRPRDPDQERRDRPSLLDGEAQR